MADKRRLTWALGEEHRLTNYQHQHRGLSFVKMRLPPTTDRRVNVVGFDNRIYKGKVARVPLDQFPPDVDPMTIDEEALYQEIRDMQFPPVPKREHIPIRRVGGTYTTTKRLSFAPIKIHTEEMEETSIIGSDGHTYRATQPRPFPPDLDKKVRGSKRPVRKHTEQSSSRPFLLPTVVALRVDGQPVPPRQSGSVSIDLPATDVWKQVNIVCSEIRQQVEKGQKQGEGTPETTEPASAETQPESLDPESYEAESEATEAGVEESKSESTEPIAEITASESEETSTEAEDMDPEAEDSEEAESEETEAEEAEAEETEAEEDEAEETEAEEVEAEEIESESE